MPWPKVQRRLAQLIQEDRFYTEEEQDRFDNIDPIAIREALEERGIVNGQVADSEKLDNDPFIQQVMSDAEQIAAAEAEQTSEISISDEEYDAVRSPIPQKTSYDPAAPVYAVGDTVYICLLYTSITIIAPTPYQKKIEEQKLDPDTKAPILDKDGKIVTE